MVPTTAPPTTPSPTTPPDDGTPTRVWLVAALTVAALELVRASGPLLDHAFAAGVVTAGVTAVTTYAVAGLVALVLLLATGARAGVPSGRTLLAGTGVLAVARLVLQATDGDVRYWLGLACVAWACGVLVLAVAFVAGRPDGPRQAAFALLLGCGLSVALQLLLGTWDAVWRTSPVGWTVAAVVALAPLAAFRVARPATGAGAPATGRPRRLWAVGPFLALAVTIGANPAFVASQSGVGLAWAGLALVGATSVGCWLLLRPDRWAGGVRVGAGALVVLAVAVAMGVTTGTDGPAALVAVVVLDVALAVVLVGTLSMRRPAPPGTWRTAGAAALVGLGVVGPLLLYMLDYDVPLPVDNALVPVLAALAVALSGLHHRDPAAETPATGDDRQPARVRAVRLLLVPPVALALVALVTAPTSTDGAAVPAAARGAELTVLDWNLHYGVSPAVGVDLEEVATTIEAADPDVVLLQEVERGWVFGGGVDMASWLADRLGMTVRFAPAADHQFGNAVLARSALDDVVVHPLPYGAGPQQRSALSATVTTSAGVPVRVTSVHLQHREENTPTRLEQLGTLLADAPVTGPSVLGGDLNAEPGWPELALLEGAGWVSAVDTAGDPAALTSPADEPRYRIDWVLGQQVTFTEASVVTGVQASDHLPVVARLSVP
ncbi:endonuclease/exonuclease/phosphatase family protein [Cellulomonas sp. DKR-3]|uniref:Endonuclease/exonuclease/phosphatase family protein n=1 Tax=Cellulomonas fulva TaxID=2835530 RepID=A0ABS5TUF2_9CELL|nr:endonuclease/exonuclease/phosphatase family protein [Cellulomonas fulva]